MKFTTLQIALLLLLTCCQKRQGEADAYGNFEAQEVIVSAETGGRIITFGPVEGTVVKKGQEIALIDTTVYHLQRSEIEAGISSVRTRLASVNAQNGILNQQIANLEVNIARIASMLKDDAATKKQYDDLTGQAEVLRKQIAANNTQKNSIAAEISVYEARKATVSEQMARCLVKSPLDATIIEKYAEEGEITGPGKPLAKMADLSVVKLKVYVSGAQLGDIKLGQECTVRIDQGEKGYRNLAGKIAHISGKAEFTPKIIQTKEERVTLVYAVTIDVPNDGTLKSGMPGEAIFGQAKN